MKFMLITNMPELASYAESCGVDRIFIDLEINGKKERQGHLDTLISQHTMDDIRFVKTAIDRAELLVRLNPLHKKTQSEVDKAIDLGADLLMLPMFKSAKELNAFSDIVHGRVGIIPLVETHSAMLDMHDIVKVSGLSEIYIGLNDLHLDMGLKFMFEPLANGMLDQAVGIIKRSGLPFGFGGIARIGEGDIPGELILAEHVRLGSNSVILSRTFHKSGNEMISFKENTNLNLEMGKLLLELDSLRNRDAIRIDIDHNAMIKKIIEIANKKKLLL